MFECLLSLRIFTLEISIKSTFHNNLILLINFVVIVNHQIQVTQLFMVSLILSVFDFHSYIKIYVENLINKLEWRSSGNEKNNYEEKLNH